jgi:predicted metal-dependent phosphoesterase TrpH
MKADLHSHTNFSDGKYSPDELLDYAINNNIDIISITDHDTFSGVKEAVKINKNIKVILGIELSTYLNDESVHILGYFKNLDNVEKMEPILNDLIIKRKSRAIVMLDKLEEFFNIKLDRSFLDDIQSITRGTISKEIIKQGYQYSNREIFTKMIGDGCPAYLPSTKMDTKFGIKLIKDAGGLAVLAHPMLLKKNDPINVVKLGVDGIEAIYPNQADKENIFRKIAKDNSLFITGGTDFHYYNDGRHGNLGQTYLSGDDLNIFLEKLDEC